MVKKFVIKPWMIVVASVVIIGGVVLFFVLNKGDDSTKSTPTDKSSEFNKGPQTKKALFKKIEQKITKAKEAQQKTVEAKQKVETAKQEVKKAKQELETAKKGKGEAAKQKVKKAKQKVKQAEQKVVKAQTEVDKAKTEVVKAQTEVDKAKTEAAKVETKAESGKQEDVVIPEIGRFYKIGKNNKLVETTRSDTDPSVFYKSHSKNLNCFLNINRGVNINKKICDPDKKIDGKWSEWEWKPCTKKCGPEEQTGTRKCVGRKGGKDCSGNPTTTRNCGHKPCPVDARWSGDDDWSEWSKCSTTCGPGKETRVQRCIKGNKHGTTCSQLGKAPQQERDCEIKPCPVNKKIDGKWSEWEWTPCTKKCDPEGQTREKQTGTRKCVGRKGGKDCSGKSTKTRDCGHKPCPVDARWSGDDDWSKWSECSTTCGPGKKTRVQLCIKGNEEGITCSQLGKAPQQEDVCEIKPCPIHGGFTEWTPCSEPCGDGIQTRTCTNPPPQHGGDDCVGKLEQKCNNKPCAVDFKVFMTAQGEGYAALNINGVEIGAVLASRNDLDPIIQEINDNNQLKTQGITASPGITNAELIIFNKKKKSMNIKIVSGTVTITTKKDDDDQTITSKQLTSTSKKININQTNGQITDEKFVIIPACVF